jgi:ABC-type amino acid transport substrate-binding protein
MARAFRNGGALVVGRLVALVALLVTTGVTACGNVIVGSPSAQTVPLRIRGTPPDATVTIDDQRVGSLSLVAARGIRVLPGRHRITVEGAGYLPFDVAVEAKDEVVPVDVKLVPVPD